MKKIIINFQPIIKGVCSNGTVNAIFNIVESLSGDYCLYVPYADGYYNNTHTLPQWFAFFLRLIRKLARTFRIPYYISRTIEEMFCDISYSRIIKKEKDDAILITTMYSPITASIANKRGYKVVLLAGNHNDNLYFDAVKKEKVRLGLNKRDVFDSTFRLNFYNRMLPNINTLICFSEAVADNFNMEEKIVVKSDYIPKGYDINNKSLDFDESFIIGYIGHTTVLKGLHILADAIKESYNENRIHLKVCGRVDKNIKDYIDGLGINVSFSGYIPDSDKNDFFSSLHLCVIPSLYDAGPLTAIEAMESQTPLLVSSGCGNVEYLSNYTDECVFKTSDVEDLREKINCVIKDYTKYKKIAEFHRKALLDNALIDDCRISLQSYIKSI